jgi:hypothetical protein
MKTRTLSSLAALLLTSLSLIQLQAATLTYKELVHRLTDLDHLAVPPAPGENTALASSYDRGSQYDAANDKYINWGANGDGGGVIRMEGDKSVFAEIKGPGVIWRTWSATANNGHVKIYLDGSETPAVDLPFSGYFDGKTAPFNRPHLVYRTDSNGFDNYVPIPFQKSCKIIADKDWGAYYHFNYTTFPAGTNVPTFKMKLSDEDNAALDEADKVWGNCGADPAGKREGAETKTVSVTVPAGGKSTVADFDGAGAITAIKVKFAIPMDAEECRNLLRQLALSITWDKDAAPAVWSPIGDFFGDPMIYKPYKSLPLGIDDDGKWYSYWYMPYGSHAKIEVQNDSASPIDMSWEVTHAPLVKSASSLLRFHAKWHRDAFLPERPDRAPDWTLLKTDGTGRYVGTQLNIWNPRGGWWGEGDEKWFVDGEKFPSSFGTGSEDYFGYAWSSGHPFNQALHGQPVNEDGDNHGMISVHRWHISDNIPFQKTFEGIIEKYMPNERPDIYAAVAFWYLSASGTDPYKEVPVADRIGYWNTFKLVKEPDAIEGESLHVLKGDNIGGQDMSGWGNTWSNGAQLFWTNKDPAAHAELEIKPPKAGKYKLIVHLTKAGDYGIVQFGVNGTKVGSPQDLYDTKVCTADPVELGTVDLKDGSNVLDLDVMGKNAAASSYLVGLDYIKLVPAQ